MERTLRGNSKRRDINDHQIYGNVYFHLKETQNKMRSLLCHKIGKYHVIIAIGFPEKKTGHASKALKCISFGSANTP